MLDLRQTVEYAKYIRLNGWKVENLSGTYYYIRNFSILGSFIKIQRPEKIDFDDINNISKKHRAFQAVIEPKNKNYDLSIKNQGFKLTKSPYLPSKTLHIDLTKSQSELFNQLKKDARYSLRKTENLKFSEANDIKNFRNTWRASVGYKRHVYSIKELNNLKKSFGGKVLFLSTKDGSAGNIFLAGDKVAYYWQAFTDKKGRKDLAQYRLLWEGILWAKKMGAEVFDFEGIYDERFPNKSWLGFTHFKKSFGGKVIKYPGAFVKYRFPL